MHPEQHPTPTTDPLIDLALSMSVAEMVCNDTGQDGIARLLARARTALREMRVERDALRAALVEIADSDYFGDPAKIAARALGRPEDGADGQ
jgi:hypothetical protein